MSKAKKSVPRVFEVMTDWEDDEQYPEGQFSQWLLAKIGIIAMLLVKIGIFAMDCCETFYRKGLKI